MKNKAYVRALLPIVALFFITALLILFAAPVLHNRNVDGQVLLIGNNLLFLLTVISYWLHIKSIRTENPHAFVRMVYGSLLVKMVVCMIAALLYGWLSKTVNKGAIFGCFILYVLYTLLEVKILLKFLKKSPNNA
jgi:cytochrome c oxidase assembly factor CtaG